MKVLARSYLDVLRGEISGSCVQDAGGEDSTECNLPGSAQIKLEDLAVRGSEEEEVKDHVVGGLDQPQWAAFDALRDGEDAPGLARLGSAEDYGDGDGAKVDDEGENEHEVANVAERLVR